MKALKKILIKNEWFTKQEVEELFTSEIQKCIKECSRPNQSDIFNAFDGLKPQDVKVLIIGQDPYPDETKAHGLAFSYKNGKISADDSLRNIFYKIKEDLGIVNSFTNLSNWKKQGVLLLNTALTFAGDSNQELHIKTWNKLINSVIFKLLEMKIVTNQPLVVMLWGDKANKLQTLAYKANKYESCSLIKILRSSHPSNNYQACTKAIYNGELPAFNDSRFKPFKECNEFLQAHNIDAINWLTYQP